MNTEKISSTVFSDKILLCETEIESIFRKQETNALDKEINDHVMANETRKSKKTEREGGVLQTNLHTHAHAHGCRNVESQSQEYDMVSFNFVYYLNKYNFRIIRQLGS